MAMRAAIPRQSGLLDSINAVFDRLDRGDVVRHVMAM